MENSIEFSGPVVVVEGVAFCVSVPGRRKAVVVATPAALELAEQSDGAALLAAFHAVADRIRAAAVQLVLGDAATLLFIGPEHLREKREAGLRDAAIDRL